MKIFGVVVTIINVFCLVLGIVDMFVVDIPLVRSSIAQLGNGIIGTLAGCVVIYLSGE